jgi:hypothetical protein
MNCNEARELLPALLYDNLPPENADAVRAHVTGCPACRQEFAELERVRIVLDAVAVPAVSVDVSRVFQQAAALQQCRARRWRRAAVAACGLAAALLLVVLLRLELRFDANQLIVRWGEVPQEQPLVQQPTPEPKVIVQREIVPNPEIDEQLRVLRDTVHALAGSLETRDAQLRLVLDQMGTRFATLQMQDSRRWSENDRQFAALYRAVFFPAKKGENQ